MTSEKLESICIRRFGKENGTRLYGALKEIAQCDFCVATAWTDHEVSIAFSCTQNGRVFTLSRDYRGILLPQGNPPQKGLPLVTVPLNQLSYPLLAGYLPRQNTAHKHSNCKLDREYASSIVSK